MDAENTFHVDILSVVIPAYNAEATLGEQLDALKAQEYSGAWEILVVDNRSQDGTVQVVTDYQRIMPNLRLVPAMEKQGRAYACNVGVRAAKGNAIVFCDADDVVAPGWLQAFTEALETHDLVAGIIDGDKLNKSVSLLYPWKPSSFVSSKAPILGFLPHLPGSNCGMRRSCFEAVGGFSEGVPPCEDVDISWRLQLQGYTLYETPAAVLHYRYRSTPKELWKQVAAYAEGHAYLYKQFAAHGMPGSSARVVFKKYFKLIKQLPKLSSANPKERLDWVRDAACCWGRLKGSLRLRTIYL
jgi:glycosyltransferase involved in cell wall biosynthesis